MNTADIMNVTKIIKLFETNRWESEAGEFEVYIKADSTTGNGMGVELYTDIMPKISI